MRSPKILNPTGGFTLLVVFWFKSLVYFITHVFGSRNHRLTAHQTLPRLQIAPSHAWHMKGELEAEWAMCVKSRFTDTFATLFACARLCEMMLLLFCYHHHPNNKESTMRLLSLTWIVHSICATSAPIPSREPTSSCTHVFSISGGKQSVNKWQHASLKNKIL